MGFQLGTTFLVRALCDYFVILELQNVNTSPLMLSQQLLEHQSSDLVIKLYWLY
jgi:hypothetical protein